MSDPAAGPDLSSLFAALMERIRFEHEVIGQRMTWLMTLNSFLLGGAAILAANAEKFADHTVAAGVILAVCVVGAGSNSSCLYSNYFSAVAIRESARALSVEYEVDDSTRLRLLPILRIYGRDANSFHKGSRFIVSEALHPWFFLPATFIAMFCIGGYFVSAVTRHEEPVLRWLPIAFIVVCFGPALVFRLAERPFATDRRR
jgi:hypothetical protein